MLNKLDHVDDFRLRILMTNGCNKFCDYCLNDFQPKKPIEYLDIKKGMKVISAYGFVMEKLGIVTFSGGEPGIHSHLPDLVNQCKKYNMTVKVATNGLALNRELDISVDYWHWHVNEEQKIPFWLDPKKLIIQIVITESGKLQHYIDLIRYYTNLGIKVKMFVNFYSTGWYVDAKIGYLLHKFWDKGVFSRYTGIQVNRGKACGACYTKCITLKGIWLFPNGTVSTCPQGLRPVMEHVDVSVIQEAMEGHKFIP